MAFDDRVNLVTSVPIRAALLERLGVGGPVMEYARLLEGTRIDVPVGGTRLNPRLDLSKVNLAPLIERAIEDLAKEKVQGILKDILGPGKSEEPKPGPEGKEKKPKSKSAQDDVVEEVLDILKGLIQ